MFRLLLAFLVTIVLAEETVKFAAVIYRHGDRTPVDCYPTDPYRNESLWPVKFGELTNTGKMEHFKLGLYLRERYAHLLAEEFDPDEIKVHSTDVDRTLMSAQANLAGMYPPVGKSIWNKNLLWQPIPIHTKPEHDDEVLAMKKTCLAYNKEMDKLIHSKPYKDRLSNYQSLMDYLTAYTGTKIKDYEDINNIYSNLFIENLYNLTLPAWTKTVFPDKMREPACYSFSKSAATPLLARLRAGPLLKDIMTKIKNVVTGKDLKGKQLKLAMYSGHDFTIGTLLTALKLFDGQCPTYTATILIELIYDTTLSHNFVRISYRNTIEIVKPQVVWIPYCGTRCPLERFTKLYENLITVNFDEECGREWSTAFIVSFSMASVALVVLIVVKLKTRGSDYHRGSHYAYSTVNSSGKVIFI